MSAILICYYEIMKVKHILAKHRDRDEYLVVGHTEDIDKLPEQWQLPVIPNGYGDANFEDVLRTNLLTSYGLVLTKVIDQSNDSDLVYVEVIKNLNFLAVIIDYSELLIEFRKFVNKEELRKLESVQSGLIGRLLL